MTMRQRIRSWWHAREPRERAMLALMVALLAGFAWWYGLLWPLRALRDQAAARHAQAVADLRTAEAAIAGLSASGGVAAAPGSAEALQHRVLDGAREVGLVLARQRTAADGAFVVEFEGVAPPPLFGWLGGLAADQGLAPSSLRVERDAGAVRAEVGFGGSTP